MPAEACMMPCMPPVAWMGEMFAGVHMALLVGDTWIRAGVFYKGGGSGFVRTNALFLWAKNKRGAPGGQSAPWVCV